MQMQMQMQVGRWRVVSKVEDPEVDDNDRTIVKKVVGAEVDDRKIGTIVKEAEVEDGTIVKSVGNAEVEEGKNASDRFKYFYCF